MTWLQAARAVGIISLASVVVAPISRTDRSAGVTFDYAMSRGTPPAQGFAITGHGIALPNGSTRIDVVSAEGVTIYKVGDYILVLDGKTSLVHPDTKTYDDLDARSANQLKNTPAAQAIENLKGTVEKVSGDEQLDERSVEHHRTNVSYSSAMMGQAISSTAITDLWLAKLSFKIALPESAPPRIPPGPLAEMLQKQYDLIPRPAGLTIVKSSSATTMLVAAQSIVRTTSFELKNIKQGDVDASKFVVPADFARVDK